MSHQNRWIICDARVRMAVVGSKLEGNVRVCGGLAHVAHGAVRIRHIYNAAMNEPRDSRRRARRTAWWVAFAALAGFLLADLT